MRRCIGRPLLAAVPLSTMSHRLQAELVTVEGRGRVRAQKRVNPR
jgi:hypothetical protein